jgi:hypothetical protein
LNEKSHLFKSLEEINQIKNDNDANYNKKFKKIELNAYDYKNELEKTK